MKLNILHLSDLHACEKHSAHLKQVAEGLVRDLVAFQKERGITPDLVFITGDMIDKGSNAVTEFSLVQQHVIDRLHDGIGITNDQIFMVPGNHEVDQRRVYEEIESGLSQRLKDTQAFQAYYKSTWNHPQDSKR